jgi:hypothetical protein
MQRRWFPCLLSVMLGLLLLPSAALAANATWGNRSRTANNRSNRTYRRGTWGNPNRPGSNRVGWGSRNNGYHGNPNYRQGGYWGYRDWDRDGDRDYWRHRHHDWRRDRCVDPDHDGDCDFIRHRHHRRHDDDDDDDRGWRNNGRWNGSTPPGWQHGRKTGWGDSNLPPGLAKKEGW